MEHKNVPPEEALVGRSFLDDLAIIQKSRETEKVIQKLHWREERDKRLVTTYLAKKFPDIERMDIPNVPEKQFPDILSKAKRYFMIRTSFCGSTAFLSLLATIFGPVFFPHTVLIGLPMFLLGIAATFVFGLFSGKYLITLLDGND